MFFIFEISGFVTVLFFPLHASSATTMLLSVSWAFWIPLCVNLGNVTHSNCEVVSTLILYSASGGYAAPAK